jgi:hypothetical protein
MFPFAVDPGWYESYWYSDRPHPERRSVSGSLARFGVLALLLAGSGVALSYVHGHGNPDNVQDWEQE